MTQYGDTEIRINIGSGNGLLPDGTKPLPEPMLTYRKVFPSIDLKASDNERFCNLN